MNRASIDVWVGLFVAAGIAAVIFLALRVSNPSSFSSNGGVEIKAQFDNIGGLKARAPVRSAGVHVGRVTSVTLDPQTFLGVVTLEVRKDVTFPKDSSAKILTAGLLGDQYIGIEPGGDEKNLQAGDVITQTQSAVVLENLIGQFPFNKAADGGEQKSQ